MSFPTTPMRWTGNGTEATDSGTKHSVGTLEPSDNFWNYGIQDSGEFCSKKYSYLTKNVANCCIRQILIFKSSQVCHWSTKWVCILLVDYFWWRIAALFLLVDRFSAATLITTIVLHNSHNAANVWLVLNENKYKPDGQLICRHQLTVLWCVLYICFTKWYKITWNCPSGQLMNEAAESVVSAASKCC